MPATLLVISELGMGRRYTLGDECVFGRHPDCQVHLLDPKVSDYHARIFVSGGLFQIESLGIDCNVLLNGRRLTAPTALSPNDRILMGDTTFAFDPDIDILPEENGDHAMVVTKDKGGLEPHAQRSGVAAQSAPSGAFLGDVVNLLTTVPSRQILMRVVERLGQEIPFDAAAILTVSEDGPEPAYIASPKRALSISRTMVRLAVVEQQAMVVRDAIHDTHFLHAQSVVSANVRSVLLAPLVLNQGCVGAVYLTRHVPNAYTEAQLEQLIQMTPVLSLALGHTQQISALTRKLQRPEPSFRLPILRGRSRTIKRLKELVRKAAAVSSPVLILGESGSGKELVARQLHELGQHPEGPFIDVNCGAIPDHLVESEFFGHQRGAFTGADRDKPGRLELAADGTLFLDEVGDLPLGLQVKLLRALEEKSFYRVGGVKPVKVRFRLVAATHRDLKKMVGERSFREDLYFRLNVLCIEAPPLREHATDIEELAQYFLAEFAREFGKDVPVLATESLKALEAYHWPGNIRELRNVVERVVVLCDDATIQVSDLPAEFGAAVLGPNASASDTGLAKQVKSLERQRIAEVMRKVHGRKVDAARVLGISRPTLDKKIRDYGIRAFRTDKE